MHSIARPCSAFVLSIAGCAVFVLDASAARAQDPVAVFESRLCVEAETKHGARCGVVRVPENYSIAGGRLLELSVVVLPATHSSDKLIAQYDLDGGPGFGATFFLDFYATDGAGYRRSRDIVLADMRGTGNSNPLRCSAIEALERSDASASLYPPELVAACAKDLAAKADLMAYTTAAAARDMDLVRHALGYQQLDLNALSYGTTLALRYISDFPKRVHAAVFVGTVPASRTPPRYHATAADRALSLLFADCKQDANCSAVFGDLAGDLDRAGTRVTESGKMSREVFMEKLRTVMYTTFGQRQVPYLLHTAAQGDFAPFAAATKGGGARPFSDGLYLSITCSETFALIDIDAAIAVANKTPFGAYRLARQRAACEQWRRAPADTQSIKEAKFDTPVLFVAGEMDPVSPPQWAEETAKLFKNSRYVLVPKGGHVFDGLSGLETCFDQTAIEFFQRASVRNLDTSCFEQMRPEPYRRE